MGFNTRISPCAYHARMNTQHLKGKTILITGASSGIGQATAMACAQAGMRVVLCARGLDALEQTDTNAIVNLIQKQNYLTGNF